jgi:hypothetical protein
MIFERTASVARLSQTALDGDKEQYVTIEGYGNININIQPASGEVLALVNGVYGQTFTAFTTVSGIAIGDRVTVSGTFDRYYVKGINDWYYAPIPHVELILFKGDS